MLQIIEAFLRTIRVSAVTLTKDSPKSQENGNQLHVFPPVADRWIILMRCIKLFDEFGNLFILFNEKPYAVKSLPESSPPLENPISNLLET